MGSCLAPGTALQGSQAADPGSYDKLVFRTLGTRAKATTVGLSEGLLRGLLFLFACEGSKVGSCLSSGPSGDFGNRAGKHLGSLGTPLFMGWHNYFLGAGCNKTQADA